jgi:endonuclease YncB( thermonuclease family)
LFFQGWLRRKRCINEEIITNGVATAKHVPTLSHVKSYNQLIERLVKNEVKAVKKKSGIWKDDVDDGIFNRTWSWFKNKLFRR